VNRALSVLLASVSRTHQPYLLLRENVINRWTRPTSVVVGGHRSPPTQTMRFDPADLAAFIEAQKTAAK
jgi:hypothetical protein